jgi:penicillin-binding protein 2
MDSRVGRTGVEKIFERELRGVDGEIRMEVDAQGRLKRMLDRVPWRPGGDIRLTLNAAVQEAAESALRVSPSRNGAAVALDPRNGEVLALASIPDFDPSIFLASGVFKAKPPGEKVHEFNLAISGTYAPGSTFKIVTSSALLNERRISPRDRIFCPGYFNIGNHTFRCWQKNGHFSQDWSGAITQSCDTYFYQMGLRTGGDAIERSESMFRLGEETKIGLFGERAGRRFGPEERSKRGKPWYDGDTANLAIGQGELLVTPVQMAVLMAAVANRGTLWRPQFVKRIEYADARGAFEPAPEALGKVDLRPEVWELLQKGLERVVSEGTGSAASVPGLVVAGKTGTAQNPHGKDHAWFVSYAGRPGGAPEIASAVLVQNGGHGGAVAAPIAKRMIEAAFGIQTARASGASRPEGGDGD